MAALEARAEMLIRSTATAAFDAFVNPGTLVRFWLARSSAPLASGAHVTWDFMVPGASEAVVVTAFERPRHLAFSWSDAIRVDLRFAEIREEGEGDAVVVTVVASGFQGVEGAVSATEGFSIVLCDLKTLLESGKSANLVRDKALLIAKPD